MVKINKIVVNTVPFDGMIPGLLDGRFDIVGDSIHYTIARAKVVDFTFPTYYYSEWLANKSGAGEYAAISDLKGKTCGALLGTNYAEWIQQTLGVTYQGYKTWIEMAQDLQNGRLDAAVHDQPIIAASIKDHPEWGLQLSADYSRASSRIRPATAATPCARVTCNCAPVSIQLYSGWRTRGR